MSPTLEDNAQGFPPVSTQFSTTSKDVLNVYETEVASSPNYTPKQRFINQSYALAKKNFIILSRSWGWTFVRAFLIPVIVAVYIVSTNNSITLKKIQLTFFNREK